MVARELPIGAAHLTYTRDDPRERITVTIQGPARLDDLVRVVERQAAEGTWQYASLYDERIATAVLSSHATRELQLVVARLTRAHGARGPVASVCKALDRFGIARMYSTPGENVADVDAEVFHDVDAAEGWLGARRR
jgi:hypothetical protein